MSWSDVSDPSSTWSGITDPGGDANRHTYGTEHSLTTRVVYGDNVRFGGPAFEDISDPSSTWADITDPS